MDPTHSVLVVRGSDDRIVSDGSGMDLATLGQMGQCPGGHDAAADGSPDAPGSGPVCGDGRYRELVVGATARDPPGAPRRRAAALEALWDGS